MIKFKKFIEYDYWEHIRLLKIQENIHKQKKSFLTEDKNQYLKLLHFGLSLEYKILWTKKDELLSLVHSFLDKEINNQDFCIEIMDLQYYLTCESSTLEDNLSSKKDELIHFRGNKDAEILGEFLFQISTDCRRFATVRPNEKFYKLIEKAFRDLGNELELKK